MRVAIVSQEYPPETAKGGIGTQAYAKAHGLARRGHHVVVVSRAGAATATSVERMDGPVRVVRCPSSRLDAHTEIADWIAYSTEVAAQIAILHEETPLDLLEFPEWGCEAYVHLVNRTEWNRVPSVIHLHGPAIMLSQTIGWPEPGSEFARLAAQMEATSLRLADAVYSSSATSAEWCARQYGVDRSQIPVLHTGVDTRLFTPQPAARDSRPTILFAGKVTWNKGVRPLLEAAIRLASEFPRLRLRMLGRAVAKVEAELRGLAESAGFPELLELPGFVDRAALASELVRADVFAAPSIYEGGPGFVYLEAMACGVPAVACAASGAAEVIVPGENGYLVAADDPTELAAVLRRILSDEEHRRDLSRRARQYVLNNGDSEKCVDRIEAFFQQVVAKHRAS